MRHLTIMLLLCLTFCTTSSGCAGFLEFRREQVDRRRARDAASCQSDTLWKQGYGFNNPNPERIRQGLEPVNFNGKTDDEDGDSYFGRLLGDMLAYSVKWTFVTIGNKLMR